MTGLLEPLAAEPAVRSDPAADRLGRGWGFPIAPIGTGRLARVSGAAAVRQSLQLLLLTEPGERVMRPDFGCPLRQFLMAPNNPGTRADIAREVRTAIVAGEPRVTVLAVAVHTLTDPAVVLVALTYQHVRDGSTAELQARIPVGGGG